jgi:hypothetical protein
LIGGASLVARDFLAIVFAASRPVQASNDRTIRTSKPLVP